MMALIALLLACVMGGQVALGGAPLMVQASGGGDPVWPAVELAADEREGQRAERYTMHLDGANQRAYTWECDSAVWAGLREGQSYRLRISAAGVPLRLEEF